MATSTTHRPVGVAPGPWLGRIAVALAVLAALWVLVNVVDTDDGGSAGPQTAVAQRDAEFGTHDSTRRAGRTGIASLPAAEFGTHDSTRRAGRTGIASLPAAEFGTHDSTRRAGRTGMASVGDAEFGTHDSTRRAGRTGTASLPAGGGNR